MYSIFFTHTIFDLRNLLNANPTKMVKRTQAIRRQFADELFECV